MTEEIEISSGDLIDGRIWNWDFNLYNAGNIINIYPGERMIEIVGVRGVVASIVIDNLGNGVDANGMRTGDFLRKSIDPHNKPEIILAAKWGGYGN